MTTESDPPATEKLGTLLLLVATVVLIQLGIGYLVFNSFDTWESRGALGDMFGAVNTLFSGLAFAGVVYTLILQRRELALQREELRLTRQELRRSAEAQEEFASLHREEVGLLKAKSLAERERHASAIAPRLHVKTSSGPSASSGLRLDFVNEGGSVHGIEVRSHHNAPVTIHPAAQLLEGQSGYLTIGESDDLPSQVEFTLEYTDKEGSRRVRTLEYNTKDRLLVDRGHLEASS